MRVNPPVVEPDESVVEPEEPETDDADGAIEASGELASSTEPEDVDAEIEPAATGT